MSECGGRSLTGARWRLKPADERVVARLSRELGISRVTARAMSCRGISDPAQGRRFLERDLSGLGDPFAMRDMDRAVAIVQEALAAGGRIRIYGDYDVDGVCGTAMLVRALEGLARGAGAGCEVDWYVPHRIDEGYGLNEEAVRQAAAEGVTLFITVDCGTTAVDEVAAARALGMQVIVTDHHRPEKALPEAPVLNPWREDCGYPFKDLAGVGVAFKLVSALARSAGLPEGAELRFLDLVCLGTVADVVPLLGENRLFVQHGLQQLSRPRKAGVKALVEAAGVTGTVGSRTVAFGLAPRINAAGRMEHARAAVRLLLTRDEEEARRLAQDLSAQNARRQDEEQRTLAEAEEMVAAGVDLAREKVIVLASERWHPGVIGIVASRLVERHHRPVLLVAVSEGMGKGSGRSVTALNLWEALHECREVLTRFGGHHYAAGFAVSAERIDALRQRINEVAEARLSIDDLTPVIDVDVEARPAEMTVAQVTELNGLAPFGVGNPAPVLVSRRLRVAEVQAVGDGSHLSLRLCEEAHRGAPVGAIWFGRGDLAGALGPGTLVDVCYRPRLEEWGGTVSVRLHVEDVRVSTGA